MKKISISNKQLFTLMLLELIGTTTLFTMGILAKQDAWLLLLFEVLIGLGMTWVFLQLQQYDPNKNFIQICISKLGVFIGWPIGLFYGLMILLFGIRSYRETSELINISYLQETPLVVILAILMLVLTYILFLGLEVLARTGEILLPVLIFFIFSTVLMVVLSGKVDLRRLTPVLGTGIVPFIKQIFVPLHLIFPFVMHVDFLILWNFLGDKKALKKISYFAVISSAVLIITTTTLNISALGVDYAANATLPFLETIRLINIGDIITNLDAIGIGMLLIGTFFVTSVHLLAGALIFSTLFKIKNYRWVLFFQNIIIFIYANYHQTFLDTLWSLPLIPIYTMLPGYIIIPILILLIFKLKDTSCKKQN